MHGHVRVRLPSRKVQHAVLGVLLLVLALHVLFHWGWPPFASFQHSLWPYSQSLEVQVSVCLLSAAVLWTDAAWSSAHVVRFV